MKRKEKISNINIYFIIGIIFVCAVGALNFISAPENKPVPHSDLADLGISQYSDANITPNAVEVDPQFKNISFEIPPPTESSFFSDQFATVIKTVKSILPARQRESEQKEYGSWIWTPIMDMTPEYMNSILSDAKANGVNAIYLSVDTYLDVFVMPKGAEREKKKKEFSDKLENFITKAKSLGISVDAEAGWRNWAEGENIYKAFAVASFVKNFNNAHDDKFRGFQYDVEPYLLDSYETNRVAILSDYVALVDKTQYFLGTSNIKFTAVVPDFYDAEDGMTPRFSYGGTKDYTFNHLLRVLDKRAGSSVIIMAYRGFATGYDGSIEISENEMRTAGEGHSTKVIIAQETGQVSPSYLSFYGTSKNYLRKQIGIINDTFNSYANFGGIAIHYANSFLALK